MKYHLGCGEKYLSGYINVDFPQKEHTTITVKADLYSDLLKLKYEPCTEIRSHHVFEHFNYVESIVLLIKWAQALKMDGILRIDIPDIEALFQETGKTIASNNLRKTFKLMRLIFGSHEADWAYHINGWSQGTLTYVMDSFGFNSIGCKA